MSDTAKRTGLFVSVGRLLATAVEIAQVRLDLLGTEIELEKRRLFDGLLWAALAIMVLGVALVLFCGFVILLFWEGYRLSAIGVLALLFLMAGALLVREARQRLRSPNGMFEASVAELARDRAGLQTPNQHEER